METGQSWISLSALAEDQGNTKAHRFDIESRKYVSAGVDPLTFLYVSFILFPVHWVLLSTHGNYITTVYNYNILFMRLTPDSRAPANLG